MMVISLEVYYLYTIVYFSRSSKVKVKVTTVLKL